MEMGARAAAALAFVMVSVASAYDSTSPKAVRFEGVLARSDGQTLSIQLHDTRIVRFRLDANTRYLAAGAGVRLGEFRVADCVEVKAEGVDHGYFLARSVVFQRRASDEEKAQVLESPELTYRHEESALADAPVDPAAKPDALVSRDGFSVAGAAGRASPDQLIAAIRRRVETAFERLPNFRAKLVTSMFHSTSRRVRWVPTGVIAAEVAYEGAEEQYSEIQVNGKRPATAPETADSEYMRSFHNAWSSGDFETISHCVFAGLADADFHPAGRRHKADGEVALYEFSGNRASTCAAVRAASEVVYPSYKGSLEVDPGTGNVTHLQLEATHVPPGFPLDRAERSVDFATVRIGGAQFLLPTAGYWFGCYRNSYYCFLNRLDFSDYRHFASDSELKFTAGN
jgi:hypothetical protein